MNSSMMNCSRGQSYLCAIKETAPSPVSEASKIPRYNLTMLEMEDAASQQTAQ